MSNARSHLAALVFSIGLFGLHATPAMAVKAGDIVVADRTVGLFFVDPSTGDKHVLSPAAVPGRGYGDVTIDATGNVYSIDAAAGVVYKNNTLNGEATVVSTGGFLSSPHSIDLALDGSLIVEEGGLGGGIVRVDATSGAQDLVYPGVIDGVTVTSDGFVYMAVADSVQPPSYHLYRLDLTTEIAVPVSSVGFFHPRALASDADGNILVTDWVLRTVQRVDPTTGAVTPVSSDGLFMEPWGVTVETGGTIIVADTQGLISCNPPGPVSTCRGALIRVDPNTGTQAIVAEQEPFADLTGVDIYRGPDVDTPVRTVTWGRVKTLYR